MRLYQTVSHLRSDLAKERENKTIGLVPTMGALHPGHFSLIKSAVSENDLVVVSIFVNPLQFTPTEDLQQYPRSLDLDSQICSQLGVDIVFAPTEEEMGIVTVDKSHTVTMVVPPVAMTSVLCGPVRPGHFPGVATIVTKLFGIVQPTYAYFGEKDAQQLAIIRRLVADLNLPVEIRSCPIVREPSGLAYSSRNKYLSETEKQQGVSLSQSLQKAHQAFCDGEKNAAKLITIVQQELESVSGIKVQYIELVHPDTLIPLTAIEDKGLLAIAAFVGSTRLIDNMVLRQRKPIIAIDGPAGAGKSTITRSLAQILGLLYLDTGAMYRAVTWLVMKSAISLTDEMAIANLVRKAKLDLIPTNYPHPTRVKINGEEVTEAIRTPQVTANVSEIAAQAAVRKELVKQQQRLGEKGGIIAEGRDIGTHVFPDAEIKIFLTASVEERSKRRWQDLKNQGIQDIDLQQLEQDIEKRDYLDSHREIAPLQQASDAIVINTDGLTIEEVTNKIIGLYRENQPSVMR